MFVYKTKGVCTSEIHLEIDNETIKKVDFVRGCPGNLIGISALVVGMMVDDAIL